jgi:hypothetical protein
MKPANDAAGPEGAKINKQPYQAERGERCQHDPDRVNPAPTAKWIEGAQPEPARAILHGADGSTIARGDSRRFAVFHHLKASIVPIDAHYTASFSVIAQFSQTNIFYQIWI